MKKLKGKHVAVRSSASCEDSQAVSFAGQFTTKLGIAKKDALNALRECLCSALASHVLSYAQTMNVSFDDFYMAIVIQEFIQSDKAGVFFSKHPTDQTKKGFWIDANFGVGESVVSGEVNPDHYLIENGKITKFVSDDKKVFTYVDGEKKVSSAGNKRVLQDSEIKRLSRLCHLLLDEYDSDVEFEWCISKKKLYLLQARPITA